MAEDELPSIFDRITNARVMFLDDQGNEICGIHVPHVRAGDTVTVTVPDKLEIS